MFSIYFYIGTHIKPMCLRYSAAINLSVIIKSYQDGLKVKIKPNNQENTSWVGWLDYRTPIFRHTPHTLHNWADVALDVNVSLFDTFC